MSEITQVDDLAIDQLLALFEVLDALLDGRKLDRLQLLAVVRSYLSDWPG